MIPSRKYSILLEITLAILGICLFAFFIHQRSGLLFFAFAGLMLTAICINRSLVDREAVKSVLGVATINRKVLVFSAIGISFGIGLGMIYQASYNEPLFPKTLTWLALAAPLVGVMEEVVFRGYIQGRTRPLGIFFSILLAAAGHTLYKFIVLKSMSDPGHIDFLLLVGLTFAVGIIFGLLREYSKNIIPSVLAHAAFDIIVYGGMATAPAWLWG